MLNFLSTLTSFNIIQWFLDLKKIGLNIDKCIILSIILTYKNWPAISYKPGVFKKIFKADKEYIKNLTKDILDENDIEIFEQGVECFTNT